MKLPHTYSVETALNPAVEPGFYLVCMTRKVTEASLRVALGGLTKRDFNKLMYDSNLMPSGAGTQGYEFDTDDVVDRLGNYFGEDLSDFHSDNESVQDVAGDAIVDAYYATQGGYDYEDEE